MAIQVSCPSCQAKLTTDDSKAGRRAKCPKCGGVIEIPNLAPPEPEVLEAEVDPFRGLSDDEYQLEEPVQAPTSHSSGGGSATKPCPMCGEMIQKQAVKCRYCGEVFDPVLKKKSRKSSSRSSSYSHDDDLSAGDWVLAVLCSNIACIFAIVWMIQGKPKGSKMLMAALGAQAFWFMVGFAMRALENN